MEWVNYCMKMEPILKGLFFFYLLIYNFLPNIRDF